MAAPPAHLRTILLDLQKHYDARSPSVPTAIPLPASSELAKTATQEWIVKNLIVPEEALQRNNESYNEEHTEEVDGGGLGAVAWRRAFWKRVVQEIEIGVRESPEEEELECHEEILMLLGNLMGNPGTGTTSLRRFHYTIQNQKGIVKTLEDDTTISQGTTGLRTWQASIRLANHLIAYPSLIEGRKVLELGSGAGMLCSIIAQLQQSTGAGGSVVATDFDERVLQRLRGNIEMNKMDIAVRKLGWADEEDLPDLPDFDLILGADVTYDPDLAPLLVGCLSRLLKNGKEAYISATVRNETTQNTFNKLCNHHHLTIQGMDFRIPSAGHEIVGGYEELAPVRLYRIRQKGV